MTKIFCDTFAACLPPVSRTRGGREIEEETVLCTRHCKAGCQHSITGSVATGLVREFHFRMVSYNLNDVAPESGRYRSSVRH